MADGASSQVHGREELIARMRRQFGTERFGAQVGTKATSPVNKSRSGKDPPARDAVDNIIVLRTQAKNGRKFAIIPDSIVSEFMAIWATAINSFLRGNAEAIMDGARRIGEEIIKAYQRNIDEGEGSMKPLVPYYERLKEYRYGDKPILEASGQLKNSFVVSAIKR